VELTSQSPVGLKILHVQGIFSPEHGGPAHSLANYCLGQARRGNDVEAWVLEGFPHTSPAIRLPSRVKTVVSPVGFPAALGRSTEMRRLFSTIQDPEIIHLHGTWLRAMHYGALEARRRRVPYILEVMGMYEAYSLRQKWLRKRLARWWFQDTILKNASCLHVNSAAEGAHLRKLGFRQPLAVIPVGVDTEAIEKRQRAIGGSSPWPELKGRSFFLFLSRVHGKKGIEVLLESWAGLAPSKKEWVLVLAGSGSPDYVAYCKQRAADLGIAERCFWTGQVTEDQKTWLLSNAGFFVLPSYSENFGNVVPEALAHGAPVITTDAAPWAGLRTQRCGWVVRPTVEGLSEALTEALGADRTELQAMGAKGRDWCRKEFALTRVLDLIDQTYHWLLARGPAPSAVLLD